MGFYCNYIFTTSEAYNIPTLIFLGDICKDQRFPIKKNVNVPPLHYVDYYYTFFHN